MTAYSIHGPTSTRDTADWRDDAACTIHPDAMFPDNHPASIEYALSYCRRCPVLAECRNYVLTERIPYGVWGGLTEDDRKKPGRRRGPRYPASCGTEAGARKHRRLGETVCSSCRRAETRERKKREDAKAKAAATELAAAS